MRLHDSPEEIAFRAELREWLASEVPAHGPPPPHDDWDAIRAYDTGWQRKLFEAGYAGMNWPREYGGRGATLGEQLVYFEETARANAPYIGANFIGANFIFIGVTIMCVVARSHVDTPSS